MEGLQSAEVLDHWRVFFQSTDSNIFNVIKQAITVAASDRPNEFKLHRDRIAQILYASSNTRVTGICSQQSPLASNKCERDNINNNVEEEGGEDDEVLNDEECWVYAEVLRIRRRLDDMVVISREEEEYISGSLVRLRSMGLSYEVLKQTQIGGSVTALRMNRSLKNKDIRVIAKKLVYGWRETADEWVEANNKRQPSFETPNSVLDCRLGDDKKPRLRMEEERAQKPEKKAISVVPDRLQAAKRKVEENYQRFESAKRQKIGTIRRRRHEYHRKYYVY